MSNITKTDLVDVLEQILEEQVELEAETNKDFTDNFINLFGIQRLEDQLLLTVLNGDTKQETTFQITVKKVNS